MTCEECSNPNFIWDPVDEVGFCPLCGTVTFPEGYEEPIMPSRELTPEELAAIEAIPF